MEYFIFLILVAVIFFIGKFIYDSYITDNTEKEWEELKRTDPKIVSKVENSNFGVIKESVDNDFKVHKVQPKFPKFQEILIAAENEILKMVKRAYDSNPFKDTELEGMEIINVVRETIQIYKERFVIDKEKFGLSEIEILKSLDELEKKLLDKIFKQ